MQRFANPGRSKRLLALALCGATALLLALVVFASGRAPASVRNPNAGTGGAGQHFLSLVPACGCGRRTVLAAFSLADGRRLRTIATVPTRAGGFLSLSGGPNGEIVSTASAPARCSSNVLGCGPVPGTCSGQVSRLVNSRFASLFTAPDSLAIAHAVASPDGRHLAMLAGPCVQGTTHVIVRDLGRRTEWVIGADLPRCTSLGVPAWSADGRELAIPLGSVPNHRDVGPPGVCPVPHYARLAITPALHSSRSSAWKMIRTDPGCSFEAATFDPAGIAAVEGCRRAGVSGSFIDPGLGQARLLQLDLKDRTIARFALQPGWEQGAITTEPSGRVVISQDQPANEPYPERDWVWELDRSHLRLVAHYAAHDAAEIIAIP